MMVLSLPPAPLDGFSLLVGANPEGYRPRIPVLFHPPEGSRVLGYPENRTRHREHECHYCERPFVALHATEDRAVPCMCCSLRCSKRMRGISDPPPRVVASFNRWHPTQEKPETSPGPAREPVLDHEAATPPADA